MNLDQAPVVQKLDSAIQRINTIPRISIRETNCAIQWIVIYPMDSVIHHLNNWGQLVLGTFLFAYSLHAGLQSGRNGQTREPLAGLGAFERSGHFL